MADAQHTAHPDVHEHGLANGCPRCVEHARTLRDLDDEMLAELVRRTLADRFGSHLAQPAHDGSPFGPYAPARSEVEAVAMASVMTLLERIGQLAAAAPGPLAAYLRERWHLQAEIVNPRAVELAEFRARMRGGTT